MIARKPLWHPGQGRKIQESMQEHPDPDHRLYHQLRQAGMVLHHMTDERGGQKRILALLNRHGSMTQRELTEILGIQSGSASEILGKIEAAGLIERHPNEEDQRTVNVTLTQDGIRAAREAEAETESRISELFTSLTEEEKEQLSGLLDKVGKDWQARFPHRPRHPHGHHRRPSGPEEGHGRRGNAPDGMHGKKPESVDGSADTQTCPMCPRHCPADSLSCPRGRAWFEEKKD